MSMIIKGTTGDWEIVCGLEVHAQVISNSKLFSSASTKFGAAPNANVSLVDAGLPGMLPVLNEECVAQAVRTGLGLNAKINLYSAFDRKNYFYADLPQGYQISQLYHPIVGEGVVSVDLDKGTTKDIRIERLHLEQDAGKSIHDQDPKRSFIDLNRVGVALMEIVSFPDISSPEEAGAYLTKLRTILRYLGTCDGNMDEGSMRADVNVSVRRVGETELRTRTETKNVNSIRFVMQVIEAEAKRQVKAHETGEEVVQQTRLWDVAKGETRAMRSKEFAHDYRYFPCPDLLPLTLEQSYVDGLKDALPELPDAKKQRFETDYSLKAYDAGVLVAERRTADFFETVAKGRDSKLSANWVMGDFFGALNKAGLDISTSPVSPENLGGLIDLIADGSISGRTAKEVFEDMWESGKSAATIVDEKGLKQISDTGAIEAVVDEIIANNPKQVEQYKGGNEKLLGFFVGQTMKATGGQANPGVVNKIIKGKLN
ncbi:MAG: Asp-tRNA(Asn)/Glu-tRNA(Gln) amidotransferase subunit GatB [Alphaproteobacteria bacterium]